MLMKNFGRSDKQVSILGFGSWGIGKSEWVGADDKESKRIFLKAIEEGISFFDTALAYGEGHSEKILGKASKESGKEIFIATKIPSKKREWPCADSSTLEESFPTKYIIETTEKSLKNLNRDYVDLQQFHVWNDRWAHKDEWKEAITKLKKDGKVRFFGISINDHQPENGMETGKSELIDSFQVIFNIFEQNPLHQLFPFCERHKISIIARAPFDEGSLTGNIDPSTVFPIGDWRNEYFRGKRKMDVKLRVDEIWKDVKLETGSMSEAALRFIISFSAVTTVIPGMRQEKNLTDNLKSVQKGTLPAALLEKLKVHHWNKNFYD
ncbi:MAG: aldo/keto reductase [Ignavibacteriaceae bacterium]|nr:aldo/keto reductase [Ignavibacteriaceae bacterium]